MVDLNFYIYDLETFPNCFTFSGKFRGQKEFQVFELSSRKNQRSELLSWLSYLQNSQVHMVGYNNLGFDYPLIHELLNNPFTFDCQMAYQLCNKIINTQGYGFSQLRMQDRILSQIDLAKINHFDNKAKRTSLKALQFATRAESVEDLPIEPGTYLTSEQMDQLIAYNLHDVTETERFLERNLHLIQMRKELLDTGVLTGDVLNFNDVKIGTEYLIKKIGRNKCFIKHEPRQTFRESIVFKDIILPKIYYRTEPFQEVLDWFNQQIFYVNGGEYPKFEKDLSDLKFFFGVGGVHASVESKKFVTNDEYVILDVDVASMYPSIAIANGFYPEHIGPEFVEHYKQIKADRNKYMKGTSMNKMLKLAQNGVFGNTDNSYSCFYDPRYPKQVTVNGQLQILQLAEMFSLIPGVKLIQANTDGITAYVPRKMEFLFRLWMKDWEKESGLELEEVEYDKMWIRDVNNYLCIAKNGKVKRKGAYWYPIEEEDYDGVWNKDFSMIAVPKTAEICMTHGWKPEAAIKLISDPFDFMIRAKTPAGAAIYIGEKKMLKTVRYYVSKSGQPMRKVSTPKGKIGEYKRAMGVSEETYNKIMKEIPPGTWDERIHNKKKSRYEAVTQNIESGWLVKECNRSSDFNWEDLNWDYYVEEVKKLLIGD